MLYFVLSQSQGDSRKNNGNKGKRKVELLQDKFDIPYFSFILVR